MKNIKLLCLLFMAVICDYSTAQKTDTPKEKPVMKADKNKFPARVFEDKRIDWGILLIAATGQIQIGGMSRTGNVVLQGNAISTVGSGVYARIKRDIFYIKPDLEYAYSSGQVGDNRTTVNFQLHKMHGHLTFGAKLWEYFTLEAGPNCAILLNATDDYSSFGNAKFGRIGIGYRGGLGFDNNAFFLTAGYQGLAYSAWRKVNAIREMHQWIVQAGFRIGGVNRTIIGVKTKPYFLRIAKDKIRVHQF